VSLNGHVHVGFVEYGVPMSIVGYCTLFTVCVLDTCV